MGRIPKRNTTTVKRIKRVTEELLGLITTREREDHAFPNRNMNDDYQWAIWKLEEAARNILDLTDKELQGLMLQK